MKTLHRGFAAALAGALFAAPVLAKGPGTSTANFLKMGVGGRGVAMGEAHTAATNDALSIYWNPGVLGTLYENQVGFMRNNYFQGVDHDAVSFIQPTATRGTFAAGASLLRVGDIQGYDEFGVATEELSASDLLVTLGWGRSWDRLGLLPGLNTGVNVKFLNKKLGDDAATGLMADVGFLYEAKEGWAQKLKTGLVVQNVGPDIKFIDEASPLPRLIKLGVAYPFLGDNLTVAADVVHPADNDLYFNMGAEYTLWNILAFRLGYKGQNDLDSGITYGAGFGNERMRLDYAFVPFGKLGDSHRVSVGFKFGKAFRKTQVQDQIRQQYDKAAARFAQGYLLDAYIQASEILGVAPWHRPTRLLKRKIEDEFKDLETTARKELLTVQVEEHFAKGEEYFQADQLIPAKREFEAIVALQPNHIGARTYLKRIDERFKSLVDSFYDAGMRYFAAQDYDLAVEQFEKVLVVDPNHGPAQEQIVRAKQLLKNKKAILEKEELDKRTQPLYDQGLSAFQRKNYAEAYAKFEEVLAINPGHENARRYRDLCREYLGKEAFEDAKRAAQEGQWQKAYDLAKKSNTLRPTKEAQELLDQVRDQLGEQKKEQSKALYKQGLDCFLSGDENCALDKWEEAVDLDPTNQDARTGLERIRKSRGTK